MSAVTARVSTDLRNRIVAVLREDRDVRNIGALADQLEAAIRSGDPVAWLRHGEETPVQNVPFGAMWISEKGDPRAFPVYDHPPPPVAVKATELDGVSDALAYGKGIWRTCTGCHESNEGYPTGPYSNTLKCHLGGGCFECGGIGAVWDATDYEDMGKFIASAERKKGGAE